MDLPGLEESLKEMDLIGGMKMKDTNLAKIEPAPETQENFDDFVLRRDFTDQVITMQTKFLELVEMNCRLRKEVKKLQNEKAEILRILGA